MSAQGNVKQQLRTEIKEPKRYQIMMHNDDYTPMNFVVDVLMLIFGKGKEEAVHLMLMVHKGKKVPVGTFSYDIALTKVKEVTSLAREEGYPFRLTIEEA